MLSVQDGHLCLEGRHSLLDGYIVIARAVKLVGCSPAQTARLSRASSACFHLGSVRHPRSLRRKTPLNLLVPGSAWQRFPSSLCTKPCPLPAYCGTLQSLGRTLDSTLVLRRALAAQAAHLGMSRSLAALHVAGLPLCDSLGASLSHD